MVSKSIFVVRREKRIMVKGSRLSLVLALDVEQARGSKNRNLSVRKEKLWIEDAPGRFPCQGCNEEMREERIFRHVYGQRMRGDGLDKRGKYSLRKINVCLSKQCRTQRTSASIADILQTDTCQLGGQTMAQLACSSYNTQIVYECE